MNPDSTPSRILLLGNDPADQQWSMINYGHALQTALSPLAGSATRVDLCAPDTTRRAERLRRLRIGRAASMYWSRYVVYPRMVRQEQADIYHILDHGNGWLTRYLEPSKTVITCHDLIPLIFRERGGSLFPWVSQAAFRHVVRGLLRATAVIANSSCTKRDLIDRIGCRPERIHVIPLGVDPDLAPPLDSAHRQAGRQAFHFPDGILLLHVGQTAFYKNLEGLLQTLYILIQQRDPAWLIRAGALLTYPQRQLARRLGVFDRIVELGPLSRPQLRNLYQAVDLFVYPSWYEGLGLPPLEAMASGLPVVVSNRGALPETVGDAGLIVDPSSPESIADAIQRLAQDPRLRSQLGERGRAQAATFRWETAASKTLRLYQLVHRSRQ